MRRLGFILTCFCILCSACAPALTATPVSTQPLAVAGTPTLLLGTVETPSATPTTSETPTVSPTRTITPLPTIPTFTPTFDVRTIVTATLAPRAVCPNENPNAIFAIPTPDSKSLITDYPLAIKNFLDEGGSLQAVYDALKPFESQRIVTTDDLLTRKPAVFLSDLTNDDVPELIVSGGLYGSIYIYGCDTAKSKNHLIYSFSDLTTSPRLEKIQDMNLDGIPEVVVYETTCAGFECGGITILEWDGRDFKFASQIYVSFLAEVVIQDIDGNGTTELIWRGGNQVRIEPFLGPWRSETHVFTWNGNAFVENPVKFEPADFRFQAVQEADSLATHGDYTKALVLYQDVVFSDKLDWWSEERRSHQDENSEAWWIGSPTPTLTAPDLTEFPRLAAYAYYRMVILHTYLGEMEAAQVKYATLQGKFPAGQAGHPYAEMASAFWEAYQPGGNMYNACAAAIAYADAHPEILTPLGSDYHGAQSHMYVPADVCPFR